MIKTTITEDNIKRIAGQLRKFFLASKIPGRFCGRDEVLVWHQWTGGMKKRIGHVIDVVDFFDGHHEAFDTMRTCTSFSIRETANSILIEFYNGTSDEPSLFSIHIGDNIAFVGNRIIVKTRSLIEEYKYLYMCFQINSTYSRYSRSERCWFDESDFSF